MGLFVLLIGAGLMAMCARLVAQALTDARAFDAEMKALRQVPIGSLGSSDTLVAIRGKATKAGQDPITGEPVAHAHVEVLAPYAHEVKGRPADLAHEQSVGEVLGIDDGSGTAKVHMESVDWHLPIETTEGEALTPAQQSYLESNHVEIPNATDQTKLRVTHRAIAADLEVTVVGYPKRGPDGVVFASDSRWQTMVTPASVTDVVSGHRSSAGGLTAAMVAFVLTAVGLMAFGAWLQFG